MGQQLFKVHQDTNDETQDDSNTILSISSKDDISFFFLSKPADIKTRSTELNNSDQLPESQNKLVKQIRSDLSLLTKLVQWERINNEINDILMNNVFNFTVDHSKKATEGINDRSTYKQCLHESVTQKLKDDNRADLPIFPLSFIDSPSENTTNLSIENDQQEQQKSKRQSEQLSYFAVQSLVSILLVLIQSAEKNNPTIIHQILALADQLCEQLPMKCLSSKNNFLFKALKPLTNYIHELSSVTDPIIARQSMKILLTFSIAKGTLKDILPLLSKLIFNTDDIFNAKGLFLQLNCGLTKTMKEWEKQKQKLSGEEKSDSDPENDDNPIWEEMTGKSLS